MKKSKPKKYWYKFVVGECLVCGKDLSYKERKYTKKPKLQKDRYTHLSYQENYCHCLEREAI